MSALEKTAGDVSGMDQNTARHALIDLGLVHAALEMKTEMSPDEMKEKLRLGAQAVMWMFGRAETVGELRDLRTAIGARKRRHEKAVPRVKRHELPLEARAGR